MELITLVEVGDGIPPRFRPTKKEKKKKYNCLVSISTPSPVPSREYPDKEGTMGSPASQH